MKRKNTYHFRWGLLFFLIPCLQQLVRGAAMGLAETPGRAIPNEAQHLEVSLTIIPMDEEEEKEAFTINAEIAWSVEILAKELDEDPNINFNIKFHLLRCQGLVLNEKKLKLFEYGIKEKDTLHVMDIHKGFSLKNTQFTEAMRFSYNAPPWRRIAPGLIYYGICKNRQADKGAPCQAYGKEVLINRGFVHELDIKMAISKFTPDDKKNETCICPMCKKFVGKVKSCNLYMCHYKIRGTRPIKARPQDDDEKDDNEAQVSIKDTHNTKFKLAKFISGVTEDISTYSWLRITTSPLAE